MNKLYKFKNGKRIKVLIDKNCPVCNKLFSPRASKDVYCSRDCYYQMKRLRKDHPIWTCEMKKKMSEKYRGSGNPMYGKSPANKGKKRPEISGENSKNWKGGYWIAKGGYKILQSVYTNGKRIAEHRAVVEKHIGRKLLSDEIIHHIDGNTANNDIGNLMICTRAEHIKIHKVK